MNEGSNKENKGEDDYQSSDDGPKEENTSSGQHQHPQFKSKHPMIMRSPAQQKVIQERRKKLDDRAKKNWKKFGSRFRIPKARAPRRYDDNGDDEIHQNNDDIDNNSNSDEQDAKQSSSSTSFSHIAAVDLPGTSFITLFCDDQKVPLPPTIVDILSKQGEKLVPDSISSLHEVARGTLIALCCCIIVRLGECLDCCVLHSSNPNLALI